MVGLTMSLAAVAGYEQSAGYAIPVDDTFRRASRRSSKDARSNTAFWASQPAKLRRAVRGACTASGQRRRDRHAGRRAGLQQ